VSTGFHHRIAKDLCINNYFSDNFHHSIDYLEQGIIGKLVAVPSISNENIDLFCQNC
jgi:hypothetical protein